MTFKIGMKVVCVDASPTALGASSRLIKNAVYTVDGLDNVPDKRGTAIHLAEVAGTGVITGWYYSDRFRPAVSPKQQVNFTTGAPRDSDQWDGRRKRVEVVS